MSGAFVAIVLTLASSTENRSRESFSLSQRNAIHLMILRLVEALAEDEARNAARVGPAWMGETFPKTDTFDVFRRSDFSALNWIFSSGVFVLIFKRILNAPPICESLLSADVRKSRDASPHPCARQTQRKRREAHPNRRHCCYSAGRVHLSVDKSLSTHRALL